MSVRVGINGFGRIGRNVFRAARARDAEFEIVAVNDLMDPQTAAHLLRYDSVLRRFPGTVEDGDDGLVVDGKHDPGAGRARPGGAALGRPRRRHRRRVDRALHAIASGPRQHLAGGARKVIISRAGQGPDITSASASTTTQYDPAKHHIISNASCTTNCLAPVAKVLLDTFGIERGFMTTIHAYTNDQHVLDLPHKDLRRARAAARQLIPTSTGAAKAIGLVHPRAQGQARRHRRCACPVPDGSVVDLVVAVGRETTTATR